MVAICMPAMPLAVSSMLACARIGAVHRYSDSVYIYVNLICITEKHYHYLFNHGLLLELGKMLTGIIIQYCSSDMILLVS